MVTLGTLFADGMILQAHKPIRIYGTGEGTVSVSFHGDVRSACAENGAWCVTFPAEDYGGPYTVTVTADGETVTLSDVYVGEVLLCAGQSNMQFHMCEEATPPAQYADDGALRIFVLDRLEAGEYFSASDGWISAKKDNIAKWSALSYLIGREIRAKRDVHIGVIACSQGASVIQSWIDERRILGTALDLPREALHYDHHAEAYARWNGFGCLYRQMFCKVAPFSLGCVVWYQGESNTSRAESAHYAEFLRTMIENWREALLDAALPFYVIAIADFDGRRDDDWRRVQAEQKRAAAVIPHVVTVESADVSECDNIHPMTKSRLARRVADAILN